MPLEPPVAGAESAPHWPRLFEYTAFGADGSRTRGRASAVSEGELDRLLERRGLTLARARPARSAAPRGTGRLKHEQLVAFTTQLATLLEAGVPIVGALRHVSRRMGLLGSRVVDAIVERLEGGQSLSRALDAEPRSFPPVYRAVVRAGEHSMDLPAVLARQAQQLRWTKEVRGAITQAFVYPAILGLAVVALVVVLLAFLLPRLSTLFPPNVELPWQTVLVMDVSDFLVGNAAFLSAAAVALVAGAGVTRGWAPVRRASSLALLRVPRLGELVRMVATARFASTMSDLHGAGCDALRTLSVSGETCGNAALEAAFERAALRVRQGRSIAESLEVEPVMDPLLVQLVAVGEASGELDRCLRRVADCYDEEVPRRVKWALSLLEPAMICTAALVVGFILLAALLPILDLYESIG